MPASEGDCRGEMRGGKQRIQNHGCQTVTNGGTSHSFLGCLYNETKELQVKVDISFCLYLPCLPVQMLKKREKKRKVRKTLGFSHHTPSTLIEENG